MAPETENGSNQTDQTFFAEVYYDTQIKQLISYPKYHVYDRDVSCHAPLSSLNPFILTLLDTMGCCMKTCLLWMFLNNPSPHYGCLTVQKAGDTAQLPALTACQGGSHSSSRAKLITCLPLMDNGFSKLKHSTCRIGSICSLTNTVF